MLFKNKLHKKANILNLTFLNRTIECLLNSFDIHQTVQIRILNSRAKFTFIHYFTKYNIYLPSDIGFTTPYFTYNSWRIFLMICSIPSFVVAALLMLLPESPRFLIMKGRHEEALAIFRGIYVTNTGKPKESYPVSEILIDEKFQDPELFNKPSKGKLSDMVSNMMANSKGLFVSPILKFTIISIIINFTFHIGYYGLMMWFPELFSRYEEFDRMFPGEEAGVCRVTDYVVNHGSHSQSGECSSTIPSSVFMESLISLAAALPANLIAILGMDRLGRKFFMIFSTMTAGLCSAAMFFVVSKMQNFVVSAVFTGVIACGNASLDCLITEVFPTQLRYSFRCVL